MGKLYVTPALDTPADHVRAALDEAERMMPSLRGAGTGVLKLLHLFDQIEETLAELETGGMDVRAERTRFETLQAQLRHHKRRFLSEAGAALEAERSAAQTDPARWWWFLDRAAAQERRRRLRRTLISSLAAALVLAVAWFAYDHFVAPPPNVRQSLRYISAGEQAAQEGDLAGALAKFESAADLDQADPVPWLWIGVIHSELDEPEAARAAFATAHDLYATELNFLLERSMTYMRVGDLSAAAADAEQAIRAHPESGQAYYVRSNVAVEEGDYETAVADLQRAAELAHAAGDSQLEATARVQMATIIQQMPLAPPTP